MKRKTCLIESYDSFESVQKLSRPTTISDGNSVMYRNSIWYRTLQGAEKTCLKEGTLKKIHYKFEDDREMVEEYNTETTVLLRRSWKVKGKIGGEGKWDVEIGDPIPDATPRIETAEISESKDQPILMRRNTRINLEWRIRNLPYPIETYSVSANNDERSITIRTSNKKYFKKLKIPELDRLNLPIEQANIQCSHQFNTLIATYKKPQQLLDMEKEWFQELAQVKPIKDMPSDCKTQ